MTLFYPFLFCLVWFGWGARATFSLLSQSLHSSTELPYLSWVSAVVRPNETIMASGSGFTSNCTLELKLRNQTNSQLWVLPSAVPIQSPAAIMAVIPSTVPFGIYTVVARCNGGATSNALTINAPRVQWKMGNCLNESSTGGTIRLFGNGLSLTRDQSEDVFSLHATAASALQARDWTTLAEVSQQLKDRHSRMSELVTTQLRLSSVDGQSTADYTIESDPASLTQYHASFRLPPDLPTGEYAMSVANDLMPSNSSWFAIDFFESPDRPSVRTHVVRPSARTPGADPRSFQANTECYRVAPAVLNIQDYCPNKDCGHMPPARPTPSTPPHAPSPTDASPALKQALATAAIAGGGTIFFPRGQYFLSALSTFEIPPGVYLRGEGASLVSIYVGEANRSHHSRALFVGVPCRGRSCVSGVVPAGTVRWGLSDMTIYHTAYYYNVIIDSLQGRNCTYGPVPSAWGCSPTADGFTMLRVRIRANAFFASVWGPKSDHERLRPHVNFNFTQDEVQGVVMLTGTNWRVSHCDILGTGVIFWSGGSCQGYGGAAWGQISDNRVRNGGNALAMDQWKQVVVENNDVSGASLASAGNNIASYNGGYAHHVAVLNNSITDVWGGDREVMTYDNAGGAYFGPLASSRPSSARVVTAGARIPLNRSQPGMNSEGDGWVVEGGALVVLNGTGAGQIRRIVKCLSATEWQLDAPLETIALADSSTGTRPSFVQIMPFRGLNIFHANSFRDVGAFQFYGIGLENTVADNRNERMAGMVSWGQWRQWSPPHATPPLTGEMGCGANPNMRNVFERNDFLEGNSVVNYNTVEGANYNFGQGYTLASTSGGGAGGSSGSRFEGLSMNMLTVFRDNVVRSNGGILVADDSTDILVEGNAVMESDLQICVTNSTRGVYVRGNNAHLLKSCHFS